MIVSYIGLPGSGKTFLANKLATSEKREVVGLNDKIERRSLFFKYAIREPVNILRLLYLTTKYHRGSVALLKHKIFFLLVNAVVKEELANNDSILDEDLMQYICAMSDIPIDQRTADSVIAKTNFKMRTIHMVECDESVRLERIHERNRLPRSAFGEVYTKKFYTSLKKNMPIYKIAINKKFPLEVIEN